MIKCRTCKNYFITMYKRRIKKEISILNDKYDEVDDVNFENVRSNENIEIKIVHNLNHFKFVFDSNYPFKCCNLYIWRNNKYEKYTNILKESYMKYTYTHFNLFKNNKKMIPCPCCYNISCNWKISTLCHKMIDEYFYYMDHYNNMNQCYNGILCLKKYLDKKYLKSMDHIISNIISYVYL